MSTIQHSTEARRQRNIAERMAGFDTIEARLTAAYAAAEAARSAAAATAAATDPAEREWAADAWHDAARALRHAAEAAQGAAILATAADA